MRKLYIVTRCLEIHKHYYRCHFRGFYKGNKVSSIKILKEDYEFEEGEEYLILAIEQELKVETLFVRALKSKNIQEIKVTSH
jgi:hypothetical protein